MVKALPVSPKPRSESVVAVLVPNASSRNSVPLLDLISRLPLVAATAVRPACWRVVLPLNACFRLSTTLCAPRAAPVWALST